MRFYKIIHSDTIFAIGTGLGGIEITEEEYRTLLVEIHSKCALVNQLYNNEITIDDVPAEWQEEIQRRVDERIALEGLPEEQPISADEFYSMIEEAL